MTTTTEFRRTFRHPKSGERYILERHWTRSGVEYRSAGPLHHSAQPTDAEMLEWLDNQPDDDAYADGEWLAAELDYQF